MDIGVKPGGYIVKKDPGTTPGGNRSFDPGITPGGSIVYRDPGTGGRKFDPGTGGH